MENRDENKTRYISVDFQGGLGNHMFQYASLVGMCRELIAFGQDLQPVMPNYLDLIEYFHISSALPFETRKLFWFEFGPTETAAGFHDGALYQKLLSSKNDNIIVGFLQSWKYFGDIANLIRNEFMFNNVTNARAHAELHEVRNMYRSYPNITYVGLHVRRGDWIHDLLGRVPADENYLQRAMKYMDKKYYNVVFVLRSDDLSWCRRKVDTKSFDVVIPSTKYERRETALQDMATLSKCNHTIITVGTFGWWVGWLAGGEVVYSEVFARNGSGIESQYNSEDYFPDEWVPM